MPYPETVRSVRKESRSGTLKMPPEKTSWKISRKGITVMAVVVVCTRLETKRARISEL